MVIIMISLIPLHPTYDALTGYDWNMSKRTNDQSNFRDHHVCCGPHWLDGDGKANEPRFIVSAYHRVHITLAIIHNVFFPQI